MNSNIIKNVSDSVSNQDVATNPAKDFAGEKIKICELWVERLADE